MANDATLTILQARALDYADMTSSAFPVTDRLTAYINDGLAELHELLATHDYLRSTSSITIVAGTEAYALPSDFYKASRVWHLVSGRRHEVERLNLSQMSGLKTTGPTSGGSGELWYVPQLTKLASGGDTVHVSIPIGWENLAAIHAAIQLLNREESDPATLKAEKAELRSRILNAIEPRDFGIPDEIEDHYGRWGSRRYGEGAPSLGYRIMGNNIHLIELVE